MTNVGQIGCLALVGLASASIASVKVAQAQPEERDIFPARRASVFGEAGVFVYKGFFDGCGPGDGPGCDAPSDFGLLPTLAVGVRVHLGDNAAFTARLGHPTTTLGVSFL